MVRFVENPINALIWRQVPNQYKSGEKMPGLPQQLPSRRAGTRLLAGSLGLAVAAAAAGTALLVAGPASAAPTPSYHPGSDTATFAVTGVLDHNCPVSVGGTEVWIKPGDTINFDSSAVGINVKAVDGLFTGVIGQVAGLNVSGQIDAGTTHAQSFSVAGGKTTKFTNAKNLSAGTHKLTWTATSLAVLPLLGGILPILGTLTNVPLSSSALGAGASLKWAGVIHVTDDAPQCKLSVGTPEAGVKVGPVQVTVPPLKVDVPVPNLPTLPGGGNGGGSNGPGGGGGGGSSAPGGHYDPPPVTVPEQVMGNVGGNVGGVSPNGGGSTQLGTGLPDRSSAANGNNDQESSDKTPGKSKTTKVVGTAYTANKAPAAQLPVLLAVIAIIALSLVTATYARLYLLRRNV
jgi:hypothetical protein